MREWVSTQMNLRTVRNGVRFRCISSHCAEGSSVPQGLRQSSRYTITHT